MKQSDRSEFATCKSARKYTFMGKTRGKSVQVAKKFFGAIGRKAEQSANTRRNAKVPSNLVMKSKPIQIEKKTCVRLALQTQAEDSVPKKNTQILTERGCRDEDAQRSAYSDDISMSHLIKAKDSTHL